MANNYKKTNLAVNTEADAFAALCNAGYIRIYDGAQPATADTDITTQVLLAELQFGNPAFAGAIAGVLTANAITKETSAPAGGTATWFRIVKSDGTTKVSDGSVGTASCDINLNSVVISVGQEVEITSLTITIPKSA